MNDTAAVLLASSPCALLGRAVAGPVRRRPGPSTAAGSSLARPAAGGAPVRPSPSAHTVPDASSSRPWRSPARHLLALWGGASPRWCATWPPPPGVTRGLDAPAATWVMRRLHSGLVGGHGEAACACVKERCGCQAQREDELLVVGASCASWSSPSAVRTLDHPTAATLAPVKCCWGWSAQQLSGPEGSAAWTQPCVRQRMAAQPCRDPWAGSSHWQGPAPSPPCCRSTAAQSTGPVGRHGVGSRSGSLLREA